MRSPYLGEIVRQLVGVADAVGVGPSLRASLDDVADGEAANTRSPKGGIVAVRDAETAVFWLVP